MGQFILRLVTARAITGGEQTLDDMNCECNLCVFPVYRYGFDYGSAHFVLMSTEHFFDPTSPQYQFLDTHLKSVDRIKTPWLIFAGHRHVG